MSYWMYNEIYFKTKTDLNKAVKLLLNGGDIDFYNVVPMPKELESSENPIMKYDAIKIAYALKRGETLKSTDEVLQLLQERCPQIKRSKSYQSVPIHPTFIHDSYRGYIYSVTLSEDKEIGDDLLTLLVETSKEFNNNSRDLIYDKAYVKAELDYDYLEYCDRILDIFVNHNVTNWYDWCTRHWGTKGNPATTIVNPTSIYFEKSGSAPITIISALAKKLSVPIFMRFAEERVTTYAGEIIFNENGEIVKENIPEGYLEKARIFLTIKDVDEIDVDEIEEEFIPIINKLKKSDTKTGKFNSKSQFLNKFLNKLKKSDTETDEFEEKSQLLNEFLDN